MRRFASRSLVAGLVLLVAGCAYGPGPAYAPGYDIGADYYAPVGGSFGYFGDGYSVGPYRDFDHRGRFHNFAGAAFRGPDRGIPSIPGGFHGRPGGGFRGGALGGFHGGGFHGGGFHGGDFHGGGIGHGR